MISKLPETLQRSLSSLAPLRTVPSPLGRPTVLLTHLPPFLIERFKCLGMVLLYGGGGRPGGDSVFSVLYPSLSPKVRSASKGFPSIVALSTFLPSESICLALKGGPGILTGFFKASPTKGSMKTHGKELAAHSFTAGALGF